jgi:hypothetical protein
MLNCDPPPGRSTASSVIPLPIALFSEGLIFELYEGGQPRRTFSIRWEWLGSTGAQRVRRGSSESATLPTQTARLKPA